MDNEENNESERADERAPAVDSKKARDYVRALQKRLDYLDEAISGAEAVAAAKGVEPRTGGISWKRAERAALIWAVEQLKDSSRVDVAMQRITQHAPSLAKRFDEMPDEELGRWKDLLFDLQDTVADLIRQSRTTRVACPACETGYEARIGAELRCACGHRFGVTGRRTVTSDAIQDDNHDDEEEKASA